MEKLAARTAASRPRWRELIAGLALEVDALARTFLQRLEASGEYGADVAGDTHLLRTARDSLALILRATATNSTTTQLSSLPGELGRQRAREGVAGDDLVAAVRLDFGVIWSGMLERARQSDMAVLALHVEELWSVVDDYARAVQQSYLEERALLAATIRDEQLSYLAELLGPDGQSPRSLQNIARALAVDPDGTFRVAVAEAAAASDVHRAAAASTALGEQLFVLNQPGRVVAMWPAPESGRQQDRQLQQLQGVPGGLVPEVVGLHSVPAAVSTAYEICRTLPAGGSELVTLQQAWTQVTKTRLDEEHGLSPALLAGLDVVPRDERDVIVDTVRAYLATGSLTASARQLYCHRNTVLNRLGRFGELTGLDVRIPAQGALALVALA